MLGIKSLILEMDDSRSLKEKYSNRPFLFWLWFCAKYYWFSIVFGVIITVGISVFAPIYLSSKHFITKDDVLAEIKNKALNMVPPGTVLIRYNDGSATYRLGDKYFLVNKDYSLFKPNLTIEIDSNSAYSLSLVEESNIQSRVDIVLGRQKMAVEFGKWAFRFVFLLGVILLLIPVWQAFDLRRAVRGS